MSSFLSGKRFSVTPKLPAGPCCSAAPSVRIGHTLGSGPAGEGTPSVPSDKWPATDALEPPAPPIWLNDSGGAEAEGEDAAAGSALTA